MIDSARCLENRDFYRRMIRFCAQQGMNTLLWHFTDDQGCTLDFPSEPALGDSHAYSPQEMRELIAYAATEGITLIPELETLGHSRYITRHPQYRHLLESDADFTAICPLHPDTRSLMRRLLKDVADIFPSPWIHVGLDEVNLGAHALTAAALKERSKTQIMADYVRFIYDEVTALGKQMVMWVDRPSYDTGLMAHLPKDIIAAVWQYTPDVSPELSQRLLDDGFDVILCPGLITYDQPAYPGDFGLPNIERMSAYQRLHGKGRIRGLLATVWTPMRYLHDCLWPALGLGAHIIREQGAVDPAAAMAAHLEDFHGAPAQADVVNALCRSFALAPRRHEYLSLLKATPEGLERTHLAERATDWEAIAQALTCFAEAGSIRKEAQAFATLCRFTAWLGWLYRRAACLLADTPCTATQERLFTEGQEWLAWLEQTWDKERFADDPRKFTPVFHWEHNEYLLINFRQSLHTAAPATARPAP